METYPFEDVGRVFFVRNVIHDFRVVDPHFGDEEECRNRSLYVILGMHFDIPLFRYFFRNNIYLNVLR